MDVFSEICKLLDSHKVPYQTSIHAPAKTSQEAASIRGVDIKTGAKAMVIRSKGRFHLFVLSAVTKINFKKVKQILQTESASLATAQEVETATHCVPGCVPPFGSLFGLPTYADTHLLLIPDINFSAGRLTHSIAMKSTDWSMVEKPISAEFCDKNI